MNRPLPFLALALIALALPLAGQEDAEGCKDSSLISRMKGCTIRSCDTKDFDSAEIRTSHDDDKAKAVEGKVETLVYECTDNVSFLAIVRNAENALKGAGFTTVYSGAGMNEAPVYTAHKGGVWVEIQTQPNGGQTYTQTVVRSKEMEQQMTATAADWEQAINATGSCSIYGVLFDSGKATIQPSSKNCLEEMAKLLTKNPTWKMQVEGHTDNVGGKDANLKLSQARADSVRSWLVANGVAADRLVAKGFGETKPIAENTSDDGRAKNRRVDLRKL